jgi:hypothetical protein
MKMGEVLKTKTIVVDIRSYSDKERVIAALEDMHVPPIRIAITCSTVDEYTPGIEVRYETHAERLRSVLENLLKREVVCVNEWK